MYVIYIVINCVVLSLFYIYIVIKVWLFLKKNVCVELLFGSIYVDLGGRVGEFLFVFYI